MRNKEHKLDRRTVTALKPVWGQIDCQAEQVQVLCDLAVRHVEKKRYSPRIQVLQREGGTQVTIPLWPEWIPQDLFPSFELAHGFFGIHTHPIQGANTKIPTIEYFLSAFSVQGWKKAIAVILGQDTLHSKATKDQVTFTIDVPDGKYYTVRTFGKIPVSLNVHLDNRIPPDRAGQVAGIKRYVGLLDQPINELVHILEAHR